MTTTVQTIVTDALRESNLIPVGEAPGSDQSAEGLRLLNRIVSSVFGNEVGERLETWLVGTIPSLPNWTYLQWQYLRSDFRVYVNSDSAQTLYMPAAPQDGDRISLIDVNGTFATYNVTLNPNGKQLEGVITNLVANTNGFNRTWIYDADAGNWKKISPLTLTDAFPFPEAVEDAFVTSLALRLNPRYGRSLSPETNGAMVRGMRQLKARYRRKNPMPVSAALLLTPSQENYWGGYAFSDGNPFPFAYDPLMWT